MIPQLKTKGVTIFKKNEKIIIIGAGGHAKVIIDILRTSCDYDFVGLIDPQHLGKTILGVPVIGDDSKLEIIYEEGVRTVFVAIGNNQQRGQISNYVKKIGFNITNAISNYSYVSSTVKLGEGIAIMPGAIINPDSRIGDNSIINTGSTIDHDCIISKNVHIAPGCNIAGNVKIGEGSLIGIGTKIIPDISVGSSTVIGAGSLVIANIPSGCTAFGAPAKVQIQKEAQLAAKKYISVGNATLNGNEKKYVNDCLDSGWISSNGRYVEEFEKKFADFCGTKSAVSCCNGTAALHLSLLGNNVGPDDEIIMPSLTYIATANTVRYCGAKPVFIDSDAETWNINPDLIEEKISDRTRGILVVHLYGHPVDMDPVLKIAKQNKIFVIEDAAEAHGALYKNKTVGSLGDTGSFSFYGNKIITTGEGGMVTTNNQHLADKMRTFKGQGVDPNRRYWHSVIGYNYRMTNIEAAIGLAQLENITWHMQRRREIANLYSKYLLDLQEYIQLPVEKNWARHAFWMYSILLKDTVPFSRDELITDLQNSGIETRPIFYPIHTLPPYFEKDACYPVAEKIAARGINLPTHASITEEDIQFISETITNICNN